MAEISRFASGGVRPEGVSASRGSLARPTPRCAAIRGMSRRWLRERRAVKDRLLRGRGPRPLVGRDLLALATASETCPGRRPPTPRERPRADGRVFDASLSCRVADSMPRPWRADQLLLHQDPLGRRRSPPAARAGGGQSSAVSASSGTADLFRTRTSTIGRPVASGYIHRRNRHRYPAPHARSPHTLIVGSVGTCARRCDAAVRRSDRAYGRAIRADRRRGTGALLGASTRSGCRDLAARNTRPRPTGGRPTRIAPTDTALSPIAQRPMPWCAPPRHRRGRADVGCPGCEPWRPAERPRHAPTGLAGQDHRRHPPASWAAAHMTPAERRARHACSVPGFETALRAAADRSPTDTCPTSPRWRLQPSRLTPYPRCPGSPRQIATPTADNRWIGTRTRSAGVHTGSTRAAVILFSQRPRDARWSGTAGLPNAAPNHRGLGVAARDLDRAPARVARTLPSGRSRRHIAHATSTPASLAVQTVRPSSACLDRQFHRDRGLTFAASLEDYVTPSSHDCRGVGSGRLIGLDGHGGLTPAPSASTPLAAVRRFPPRVPPPRSTPPLDRGVVTTPTGAVGLHGVARRDAPPAAILRPCSSTSPHLGRSDDLTCSPRSCQAACGRAGHVAAGTLTLV